MRHYLDRLYRCTILLSDSLLLAHGPGPNRNFMANSYFDEYFGRIATHIRSSETQILAEGA